MKVESVPIATLSQDPANARKHDEKNLEAIKASLRRFGQQKPIVVDSSNVVRAGNGTLAAATALGWESINVVQTDLQGSEATAYAIADNRTAELAEWDESVLAASLSSLADVDETWLSDLQFSEKELAELVASTQEQEIIEDEVPDLTTDPVTQTGDLWILGEHRLLCGNATHAKSCSLLLQDEKKLDIIFTDPPYSSGGFQESGKTSGSIGARGSVTIATDNLSTRGYLALMDSVLNNFSACHTAFVFCDWKMWTYNVDVVEAKGYRVRNMLVWDKMQMGMGMPFRNQHELCVYASKIAGKIGDGKTPNVLQSARDRESKHATPKPVELCAKMLNQSPGEIVIDPFLGGGTTLIACQQIGRTCYGMELSPQYCDVIVERWEKLTGKKARLEGDGSTS